VFKESSKQGKNVSKTKLDPKNDHGLKYETLLGRHRAGFDGWASELGD
jgi:hypothetical protein